jgi:hypothetical protein
MGKVFITYDTTVNRLQEGSEQFSLTASRAFAQETTLDRHSSVPSPIVIGVPQENTSVANKSTAGWFGSGKQTISHSHAHKKVLLGPNDNPVNSQPISGKDINHRPRRSLPIATAATRGWRTSPGDVQLELTRAQMRGRVRPPKPAGRCREALTSACPAPQIADQGGDADGGEDVSLQSLLEIGECHVHLLSRHSPRCGRGRRDRTREVLEFSLQCFQLVVRRICLVSLQRSTVTIHQRRGLGRGSGRLAIGSRTTRDRTLEFGACPAICVFKFLYHMDLPLNSSASFLCHRGQDDELAEIQFVPWRPTWDYPRSLHRRREPGDDHPDRDATWPRGRYGGNRAAAPNPPGCKAINRHSCDSK